MITREKFVRAISSDSAFFEGVDLNIFDGDGIDLKVSGRKGECSWLFSPSKVRQVFKGYIKNNIIGLN